MVHKRNLKIKQVELWNKFVAHMYNEGASDVRIKKLKYMFLLCERAFKDFKKVKRDDVETFIEKLHRDEFKRLDGSKYSGTSKSDVKKFLKQFYKWLLGDNEYYPKQVSWLKVRVRKDEKPQEKDTLGFDEMVKFANAFERPEFRILALLLFDSGFRIAEMLSVKKRDLTFEKFDDDNKCFWVKCNKSKTITRKVPVPLFTEDLQQFCNTTYFLALSDDDLIFDKSYNYVMIYFKRAANKVFWGSKNITPHCLRHSSATYYSKEYDGNMNLISQRYGWSLSSEELKTYIRMSGSYQRAGAKKTYDNEVQRLKRELKRREEQTQMAVNIVTKELERMKQEISTLTEQLPHQNVLKK